MSLNSFHTSLPAARDVLSLAARCGLAGLLAVATLASAQNASYPSSPVKAVIGWEPGGVTDLAARSLAKKLGERWGQPLLVENRPGGGGIIATAAVARARPDGYTLAFTGGSEPTIRPLVQNDPYTYARDFTPVALVTVNPIVLVANAATPFKTVADLRLDARSSQGGIPFSSSGASSTPHLIGELFSDESGIKLKHIAYKGGAPAATAVASGEVPLGFMVLSSAKPFVDAGKLRVIGITTRQRVATAPDWPTIAEQGIKDFDASVWTGVYVRKETPKAIVEKLAADVAAVLRDPEIVQSFAQLGADPGTLTLEAFGRYVRTSAEKQGAVIQRLGLGKP